MYNLTLYCNNEKTVMLTQNEFWIKLILCFVVIKKKIIVIAGYAKFIIFTKYLN